MSYTFIKKHGIYLMIWFCILLLILSCFIIYRPISEGFADIIGDNEHLEPITKIINDDLWTILFNKMIKNNPTLQFSASQLKEAYSNFITKEEINYFLQNDKFPWSVYVTNRFKELLNDTVNGEKVDIDEQSRQLMAIFPNRYAYNKYLLSPDMKEDLGKDPYMIYSGEKKLPTKPA